MLCSITKGVGPEVMKTESRFFVGQLVHHRRFDYRGVVVDVDAVFGLSERWYEEMAISRPPKDRPWYKVLVHNGTHQTYVAERNLEPDESLDSINHPEIEDYFQGFKDGRYLSARRAN